MIEEEKEEGEEKGKEERKGNWGKENESGQIEDRE